MKKRILSIIVVLLLVFQTIMFQAASGAETENEVYAPYISSESFLKALGIIDGEVDFDETVTRGQAASYIAALLNEEQYFTEYREIFSDVKSDNENALAIEKLADMGIVRGDGDRAFRPDDVLNYNEATVMFMNVLGYGLINPENTYLEAKRTGLLDNVRADNSFVNSGDLLVMMDNTLMASPIVQTVYGSSSEYEKSEQTMLYKIYDIMYADGRVIKNDLTWLWAYETGLDSSIELETVSGNIEIMAEEMSVLRNSLGKNVKVYYYTDEETDEHKYVYHFEKPVNKVLNIDLSQIDANATDIQKGKLVYYRTGKSAVSTVTLSGDVCIIYNNAAYKSDSIDFTLLEGKVGDLELIDADLSGSYETVKIKVYNSIVAGNISTEYGYITDKYEAKKTVNIDTDNYERIFIYNAEGAEASFGEINTGSVISVAESDVYSGNNILEIHISEEIINGKITKYKKGDFAPYIVIDEANQLDLFDRAASGTYKIGSNIIAYIDVFGNVVYIADDATRDMQYGIITGIGMDGGTLSGEVDIRLITSAGEIIETKLDKKPIIDGKSYSGDAAGAYKTLTAITTEASGLTFASSIIPVRYKANEDKTIKLIDTVKTGQGENDKLELTGAGTFTTLSGNILGFTVPYSSDAIVLEIMSDDLTDIETFCEETNISANVASSVIKRGNEYDLLAYKSDENSVYSDFIIRLRGAALEFDDALFVVDEVTQGYNQVKDKVMYQLSGYLEGVYKEVWVSNISSLDALKNCSRGDILRITVDNNGCILLYEDIFKRSEAGTFVSKGYNGTKGVATDTDSSFLIMCGYVYSKEDTVIKTNRYGFESSDTVKVGAPADVKWTTDPLWYSGTTGAAVIVVDDSDEKVSAGSVNDILDYENFGSECSLVVMKYRSNVLKEVIVYNK